MKLRIEQRKDEPADLFVLRAFSMALPQIEDERALDALWRYMWRRAEAEIEKRSDR
jgi:hypothetical protein